MAVNVRNKSFKVLADVELEAGASGAIFAHGSRFGGHTLFMKDGKLHYVYNFLGIAPEQEFVSPDPLPPGKYILGIKFLREGADQHHESNGKMRLYVNENVVAEQLRLVAVDSRSP